MAQLQDTRELARITRQIGKGAPNREHQIGDMVALLLAQYDGISLETIRIHSSGNEHVVSGRVGELVPLMCGPTAPTEGDLEEVHAFGQYLAGALYLGADGEYRCATCRQAKGRPHTEYCQYPGIVGSRG